VIGIVVNDTLFSTIIGVSFTACLSLMAWIVRSLVTLNGKVDRMDDRLGDLELSTNGHVARSSERRR
jgi:hypothetical protein